MIGLSETWIEGKQKAKARAKLHEYWTFTAPARKEKRKGRACRGLLVAVKKGREAQPELVENTKEALAVKRKQGKIHSPNVHERKEKIKLEEYSRNLRITWPTGCLVGRYIRRVWKRKSK